MAMSVIQGGNGMPFLHNALYQYIVNGEKADILVENMPDRLLCYICQKVNIQTDYTDNKLIISSSIKLKMMMMLKFCLQWMKLLLCYKRLVSVALFAL